MYKLIIFNDQSLFTVENQKLIPHPQMMDAILGYAQDNPDAKFAIASNQDRVVPPGGLDNKPGDRKEMGVLLDEFLKWQTLYTKKGVKFDSICAAIGYPTDGKSNVQRQNWMLSQTSDPYTDDISLVLTNYESKGDDVRKPGILMLTYIIIKALGNYAQLSQVLLVGDSDEDGDAGGNFDHAVDWMTMDEFIEEYL